jgi:hypothetical protein
LAIPYPVKDSHLLFFASFAWRTPSRVKPGKAKNEQMISGMAPESGPPICALMSTRPS